MANVIRTDEQIKQLINALSDDLDLPDRDAFGISNEGSKVESREFIDSLRAYLEIRQLPEDEYDEVRGWLIGASWASLGYDYGVEDLSK